MNDKEKEAKKTAAYHRKLEEAAKKYGWNLTGESGDDGGEIDETEIEVQEEEEEEEEELEEGSVAEEEKPSDDEAEPAEDWRATWPLLQKQLTTRCNTRCNTMSTRSRTA